MKDISKIKLFVMDVDGTLTDGHIYMGNDGELCKSFHVKDGLGIKLLNKYGIIPAIITGRESKIVANRCKEMGLTELHQGVHDKAAVLNDIILKYDLTSEQTAYIGDDMNDLSAMKVAGITFAPADCATSLKPYVDILLTHSAGDAPVREAIDMILGDISYEDFTDIVIK